MNLKKLELQNFQSHKHSLIDFSKGFNCIIGQTRSGKSAIFRALDFLFYNNWVSENVTFGEKECYIKAIFNTFTIERWKGEKINKVTVTFSDGKGFTFENFGNEYPQQVKDYLGISELSINDKTIPLNTSDQDHPLFILYESGIFKSKLFGQISKTQIVDNIVHTISKDKKQLQSQQSNLEVLNVSNKQKFEEFKKIISNKKSLELIKKRLTELESTGVYLKSLKNIKLKYDSYLKAVEAFKLKYDFLKKFDEAKALQVIELNNKCTVLKNLKNKFVRVSNEIENTIDRQASLDAQEDDVSREIKDIKVCPTCGSSINQ